MRRLLILVAILIVILGIIRAVEVYLPQIGGQNTQESAIELPKAKEQAQVTDLEKTVISVVNETMPAVVTIAAKTTQQNDFEDEDPFSFFDIPQERRPNTPQNIGSGFIITRDGFVVTNKHVVSDPEITYSVVTTDKKTYDVQNIYRDPLNDIAILKINPGNASLKPAPLGNSSNLQVGQTVIAIGTPLGEFNNTVTTGVVSGLGRGITAGSPFEGFAERLDNVIQTDAAINPGNSGGPLLNSAGQVIGVNTAVSQSGQNIGFALPINVIKTSLENFNKTGQFNRPFLGVSYRMVTPELAQRNELPEGAYVLSVVPGSSAATAGIQEGDIITEFDGKKLQSENGELSGYIGQKKIGDSVSIRIFREGEYRVVTASLQAAPEQ